MFPLLAEASSSLIDNVAAIVMAILFLAYLREQRKADRLEQSKHSEALTQLTEAIRLASAGREVSEQRYEALVEQSNNVIKENTKSFDKLYGWLKEHDSELFRDPQ